MNVEWRAYTESHQQHTVVGDLQVARVAAPMLGGDREVLCLLPPGAEASGRRYPVVYMFDGQNLFDAATSYAGEWQVDETMAALRAEGLEAIIVGLTNGGEARLAEYTPYPSSRRGPVSSGRGSATLSFLAESLKPLIDASFPTRPDRDATAIAGSSLGGLMSLYAAWERPDLFGAAAAFSPAFPPGQTALVERIGSAQRPSIRVYLDTGGREGSDMRLDHAIRFWSFRRDVRRCRDALLRAGCRDRADLCYVEDDQATHSEAAWAARLPGALRFLLPGEDDGHPPAKLRGPSSARDVRGSGRPAP